MRQGGGPGGGRYGGGRPGGMPPRMGGGFGPMMYL